MKSIQIDYFLTVAQYNSFSKAAEALFVTQAAVSKQVSSLENELNMKLFRRQYRSVILTPAGSVMYNFFLNTREQFRAAVKEVRILEGSEGRALRIGFMEGIDMGEIHRQLLIFHQHNPNIQVTFEINGMQQLIHEVLSGQLDIVFTVTEERWNYPSLSVLPVFAMEPCICVSEYHPLYSKPDLKVTDFAKEVFFAPITPDDNMIHHYKNYIERICGIFPEQIKCCNNLDSVICALEMQSGVALLYNYVVLRNAESMKLVHTGKQKNMNMIWPTISENTSIEKLVEWLRPHISIPCEETEVRTSAGTVKS